MRKFLIPSLLLCCAHSVHAQPAPAPADDAPQEIPEITSEPAAPPSAAEQPPDVAVQPEVPTPPLAPAVPVPPAPTSETVPQVPHAPDPGDSAPEDPRVGMLARAGYPLTPSVTSANYPDQFVLSGYVQAQYQAHQDSEDGQLQGGDLLNRDRFLIRRARVRVTRDWEWGQVLVEADGNTQRGPAMRLQKAEVTLLYGRQADPDQPPLVALTLGQFDVPFGFEIPYSSRVRWFTERSVGSRALFTSEPDLGVRIAGGWKFLRYSVAVHNGEPLEEASGLGLRDPNGAKDVTGRLGAEVKATPDIVFAGGISFNSGRGYSPATPDTKDSLVWQDLNDNAAVDSGEVQGQPGQQGTPARNFSRWAVGADLEFLLRTKLGWSMFQAEGFAASNLDRGLFIANPVLSGADVREFGFFVSLTQEITQYGALGFRYDYYDPNADFIDNRQGRQVPTKQRIQTFTPFVALQLPGRARLIFEYSASSDYLARDNRGLPTDFTNNQWTLRLQGML